MHFSLILAVRKVTTLFPGSTVTYKNLIRFCELVFGTHLKWFSPCSYTLSLTFLLQFSSKKIYSHWVSLLSESSLKWKVLKMCVKCRLVNSALKINQKLAVGKGIRRILTSFQSAHTCSRNINPFVILECFTSLNKWIRDWVKKRNAEVWSHGLCVDAYLQKSPQGPEDCHSSHLPASEWPHVYLVTC